MEQGKSLSVSVSQINSINDNCTYDSDDEMWAENRSKHLHDPLAMKDKSVVKTKTKVGETPKKERRKAASAIFRSTLSKRMNYVIKKIPTHLLRFGAVFNFDFANEIKKSINEEGVEMFKNTIFGPYLNISKCNFQGQITKCLLLLGVQHENKDLLHVRHANGIVLQFSIKDFAIVTGLKCKENVKDFSYPESTMSRLLQRYFPNATADLDTDRIISNDRRWQIAFDKLITSLRQDFNLNKQMYRLFGMSYALNVWTYECTSSLNSEFAFKVVSGIPKICNLRVVAVKPKFGTFMSNIFSKNASSNIAPTPDEVEALDLHDIQDAHTPGPSTITVDAKKVQTKDSSGFEDFSTSPHGHLFRRSLRVSGTSSPPPPKRRKKIDTSKTKLSEPKSSEQLRPPINQSFLMPDEAPTLLMYLLSMSLHKIKKISLYIPILKN
ncbi:hypothetical protein H5410_008129 [Solanum commersonii]|uniref:Ulp1 protease family, C-terminal catalytic domain containing protein n=1 Tax=Solanum commersonii TaxID=4109 RepID=A0A9J6AFZ0_SOLCO|nr:hypothetical protein H5410_008129 [Solanum commersonii]